MSTLNVSELINKYNNLSRDKLFRKLDSIDKAIQEFNNCFNDYIAINNIELKKDPDELKIQLNKIFSDIKKDSSMKKWLNKGCNNQGYNLNLMKNNIDEVIKKGGIFYKLPNNNKKYYFTMKLYDNFGNKKTSKYKKKNKSRKSKKLKKSRKSKN